MKHKIGNRLPLLFTVCLLLVAMLTATLVINAGAAELQSFTPSKVPAGVDIWDGTTYSESLSGSGTEEDPYLIQNAADFAYFYVSCTLEDTSYYLLTADIAMGDAKHAFPSKLGYSTAVNFGGHLNGGGHTVYNYGKGCAEWGNTRGTACMFTSFTGTMENIRFDGLYFRNKNGKASLISGLSATAVLRNIEIVNGYTLTIHGNNAYGSLLAHSLNSGTADADGNYPDVVLENIKVQGYTQGCDAKSGGMIGVVGTNYNSLVIRNCEVDLINHVTDTTGAVLSGQFFCALGSDWASNRGKIGELRFENCVSRGKIVHTASTEYGAFGGFVGALDNYENNVNDPTIIQNIVFSNCLNETDIEISGTDCVSAGGFVGTLGNDVTFSDCSNYGDITVNCSAKPRPARQSAGGYVGYFNRVQHATVNVVNCVQEGNVTSSNVAGGLFGTAKMVYFMSQDGDQMFLTGTYIGGKVVGKVSAGGLVGLAFDSYQKCGYCYQGLPYECQQRADCPGHYVDEEGKTQRLSDRDYYATTRHIRVILTSCAINVRVEMKDGTAGSTFIGEHIAGLACDVVADTNTFILSNCDYFVNSHYADETKRFPMSSYLACIPAKSANYFDPEKGAVAKLNASAVETGNFFWKWDGESPVIINRYIMTNPDSLDRVYNGQASEVVIIPHAKVGAYTVEWQVREGSGYTVLPSAPVNVGSYRMVVTMTDVDGNPLATEEIPFEITPYTLDLSALTWNYSGAFTYTKEEFAVALNLTEEQLALVDVAYTDNAKQNAGNYTARATVTTDNPNVSLTGKVKDLSWTVSKAVLDASDLAVSDLTVNYNGLPQEIPLVGEISDREALKVTYSATPTDAGSYTVHVKWELGDTANYSSIVGAGEKTVSLVIKPITLTLEYADIPTQVYTGQAVEFPITVRDQEGNIVSVKPTVRITKNGSSITADQVIDVGEYVFYLSFENNENYTGASATSNLTIVKAEPEISVTGDLEFTYDGQTHPIVATTDFGTLSIRYEKNGTAVTSPRDAGTYTVTLSVAGTANYNAASTTATLVIHPRESLTVTAEDGQQIPYTGANVRPVASVSGHPNATYSFEYFVDGTPVTEAIECGTYQVLITGYSADGNSCGKTTVTVHVVSAPTVITLGNVTVVYNGEAQAVTPSINHSDVDSEGNGLTVTYTRNGVDILAPKEAGVYEVTARFGGSDRYEGATVTATLTILPQEVTVPAFTWDYETPFTFDGTAKTVALTGVDDQIYYIEYTGATATGAGTYTATARVYCTSNYVLSAGSQTTFELTWTVNKASFDLTGVSMQDKEVVYNGEPQILEITGTLPGGITVTYSLTPTDVGRYEIEAIFSPEDPNNFETSSIEKMSAILTVLPADYDMTGVSFRDGTFLYDGVNHTLTLDGTLPEGVTYQIEGATAAIGSHTLTVRFTGDANHNPIPPMTATMHILQVEVENGDKDIHIHVHEGVPAGGTLTVDAPEFDPDTYETDMILAGSSVKELYTITFTHPDATVTLTGTATVRLPVGPDFDPEKEWYVVRIVKDENGNVVNIAKVSDVTVVDGYYVFETSDLTADYGVIRKDGNAGLVVLLAVGGVAVLGGGVTAVVLALRNRRREDDDEF